MIFCIILLFISSLFLMMGIGKNLPSYLGYISSICLIIIGISTPIIWNWSRKYGTAGLLPSHFLSSGDIAKFRYLFSLASFGTLLSGVLFALLIAKSSNPFSTRDETLDLTKIRNSPVVPILGFITSICLVLGLGKSLFLNHGYLEFSGSQTLLRAANAILPAALIALGFSARESRYSLINTGLLCFLFFAQAGRGSRVILILPLVLLAVNMSKVKKVTRKVALALILAFSELVLMSLTFIARESVGGILNLPHLLYLGIGNSLGGNDLFTSFGRLCASLTSWAPTLITSIDQASAHVILANINPLIGSGSDAFSYSSQGIERLFPYNWIPLSSMGQIYGAFGGFFLVLTFFTIASIAAMSLVQGTQQNALSVFSMLAVGTYLIQFPLLFQYSSRIWLRVLWLMLVFSIFHLLSWAVPKTQPENRRGRN